MIKHVTDTKYPDDCPVRLSERVTTLLDNRPRNKRELPAWKAQVRKLMTAYNKATGIDAYNINSIN
ncbi:MAG: hypothetical protein H6550_16185 [Chitinophagales bacterium]|nr:hypothetical protein [Chitinophagales bacterium]